MLIELPSIGLQSVNAWFANIVAEFVHIVKHLKKEKIT